MSNLIPRQLLFSNPTRAQARVSPDGAWISFLAPHEGVLNVWVAPRTDPSDARRLTDDAGRGIRDHRWAHDSAHLLYLQDRGGDENWRIYAVDVATGTERELTAMDGVQARIEAMSSRHPDTIVVGLNDRDPHWHDLYTVSVSTGERTLLQDNPGFAGFTLDRDLKVRMATAITEDGGLVFLRPDPEQGWAPLAQVGSEDTLTTGPFAFDASGEVLYLADSRDRNTSALVAWNLATDERRVLAEDARSDLSDVMIDPVNFTIEAAAFCWDKTSWTVLSDAVSADLEALADGYGGSEFEVVSRSHDDRFWVVLYTRDDAPATYVLRDRTEGTTTPLFTTRPELEGLPLVAMESHVITASDGLDMVAYLSRPSGEGPFPMVLNVHGGPWARDGWGLHPEHQWLANRGYAVLSVNFRGSTGFGKAFINAANLEWGARMHEDLLDAVKWAIEQGVTEADKVAIYGGSYGGYAALAAVTFTPEVFACGVDLVGISNLETLIATIPPYWKAQLAIMHERVGNPETEEGKALLQARSPLHKAGDIVRPLLIGQGANDPRVKQAESEQIVAAMKEHGLPVTYLLYPDEGHGFARPQNRMSFYAVTERFFAEHLGGACEPVGDDFSGSSINIVEDALGM